MSAAPLNPLVSKIRTMHPGAYDDMDDAALTKAVLAKYPQYSDLAAPPLSAAPGGPASQPPMQESNLDIGMKGGTTGEGVRNPQQPAERFGLENPDQQGTLATAATIGAGGSVPGAAAKIAATVKPFIVPALASEAIHQAKNLPVVGPIVQHVPFAEMLPWMMGGKGEKEPAPENPGAPLPETPPTEVRQAGSLYRGVQQTQDPAAGLGEIPVRGKLAESVQQPQTSAPLKRGSLSQMMNNIQDQVGKGLGATPPPEPPAPGKPIYQRGGISDAVQPGGEDVPQGHTAHQSSALKSSMYDPDANEFHARMTSGDTTYVYGDVKPDEADAFSSADSKGKAYQQIKSGHPLVAKIVNGKRIAVKATQ